MTRTPFLPLACSSMLLASALVTAQSPQLTLVRDIHPGAAAGVPAASSVPREFVRAGSDVYFVASHPVHGRVLWATDDATGGVRRIVDTSGSSDVQPGGLTAVGNRLFYTATNQGRLRVTDGTPAGTVPVAAQLQFVGGLVPFGTGVVFTAFEPATGTELWYSDGTAVGTQVLDLLPGAASAEARLVAVSSGSIFFSGYAPSAVYPSLWRTDLATWTPSLVMPTMPGVARGSVTVGTDLYVLTSGPPFGLVRTDGTASGTVDLRHPGTVWNADRLTLVNSRLLVWAKALTPANAPDELWAFDLATQTWQSLTGPSAAAIHGPVATSGQTLAVFGANLDGAGAELWATDGTGIGTLRVADLLPGSAGSDPRNFVEWNQQAIFAAKGPTNWVELWQTDGTAAGTSQVTAAQTFGTPQLLTGFMADPAANRILFSGQTAAFGEEPWLFTPPAGAGFGTLQLLHDVSPPTGATLGSLPAFLTDAYGVTLFFADDGVHGRELWRSDGTPAGTQLVLDTVPGPGPSPVFGTCTVGSEMLFATRSALWGTDGTAAGTAPRFGMPPSSSNVGQLRELTAVGRILYFMGHDNAYGTELWRSDGTANGTARVADASPGPDAPAAVGLPRWLTAVGDRLFFVVRQLGVAAELWTSDGTTAGTSLVRSFPDSSPQSVGLRDLVAFGDRLVFFAPSGTGADSELWTSDGTAAGTTVLLGGTPPAPVTGDGAAHFVRAGGKLFFDRRSWVGGVEVWVTDGTTSGTRFVRSAGPFAQLDTAKCAVGEHVLFLVGLASWPSAEMWVTDGGANTVPVAGFGTLTTPYPPRPFASGDRYAWLVAAPSGGAGLWRIDAQAALAAQLVPTAPPNPSDGVRFGPIAGGKYLLLTFDDGVTGRELFRIDPDASSHSVGVATGDGARAPRLDPVDLALGRLVTFRGYEAPVGGIGVLAFGVQSPPVPVLGLEWYLGLAAPLTLAPFVSQSHWQQSLQVPSAPSLIDTQFALQAIFVRPAATFALEASNAVWARIAP